LHVSAQTLLSFFTVVLMDPNPVLVIPCLFRRKHDARHVCTSLCRAAVVLHGAIMVSLISL
jgi:hypothetical protein